MNIAHAAARKRCVAWALGVEVLGLGLMAIHPARSVPWLAIAEFAVAWFGYLLAIRWLTLRFPDSSAPVMELSSTGLWAGAILLRIVGLMQENGCSDDLFRYLWEGHAGLMGHNPYLHAPVRFLLDMPADTILAQVNHPTIPSVYPPLAQRLFQGIAAISAYPLSVRIVFTLFDLLTLAGLARLVRQHNRAGHNTCLALYAWHPLPVVELAGNGHMDSAAIACLVLGLGWLSAAEALRSRGESGWASWLLAGLCLGAGAWMKLLPALLLPLWLWKAPGERRGARLAWGLGGVGLQVGLGGLLILPYWQDRSAMLSGLRTYAAHWSFNPSLFRLLEGLVGSYARGSAALLLVGWTLYRLVRPAREWRVALELCLGFFLLSPTAHPWYLLWALPFVVLAPYRPLLLLSLTVFFGYAVFDAPSGWEEKWYMPWLTYGPPLLLLGWEHRGRVGSFRRGPRRWIRAEPVDKSVDKFGDRGGNSA